MYFYFLVWNKYLTPIVLHLMYPEVFVILQIKYFELMNDAAFKFLLHAKKNEFSHAKLYKKDVC